MHLLDGSLETSWNVLIGALGILLILVVLGYLLEEVLAQPFHLFFKQLLCPLELVSCLAQSFLLQLQLEVILRCLVLEGRYLSLPLFYSQG